MVGTPLIIIYILLSIIILTTLSVITWEYIDLCMHKNKSVAISTLVWFMSAWDKTANLLHKTKVGEGDASILSWWEFPESIKKCANRIILGWILILPTITGGFFLLDSLVANYNHNSIPELILDLEEEGRWNAIKRLSSIGNLSVEPMIVAFHDTSDPYLQSGIIETLSQIDDGSATNALITVLNDEDPALRAAAAEALAQIVIMNVDERVLMVEPLIAVLNDQSPTVREKAALGLGLIGDKRAVEPLIALLNDVDQAVRVNSAQALLKIGDERAEIPLLAAFKRGDLAIIAKESAFFIERADEGTESIFIAALNSYGTKETANYFLNCGNTELENAAREWAKLNGYVIGTTSNTSDIANWGGN